MTVYGIYGTGGFGRQVYSFLKLNKIKDFDQTLIYFIDDNPHHETIFNQPVVSYDEFLNLDGSEKYVNVAIANSTTREKLCYRLSKDTIHTFQIISDYSVIMSDVSKCSGLITSPFSIISSNVIIGESCHIGFHTSISHDCIIGDFVTFATGVRCNGNVHIEDRAYIGSSVVIKQGKPKKPLVIGEGAVIGMGAVVTKDVPAGVTMVGNPARPLIKVG